MKYLLIFFLTLCMQTPWAADHANPCQNWSHWAKSVCERLHQVWTEGDNELYMSGYAWHNRFTYSQEKIDKYNELAWGGGMGKGFYDENGDWHGLYAFAFLDSHKNVEPIAGYAFLKIANINENMNVGAGLSVFITARSDIFHNIPFPGLLPCLSLTYRRLSFSASYIPGTQGAGNVLFLATRWRL